MSGDRGSSIPAAAPAPAMLQGATGQNNFRSQPAHHPPAAAPARQTAVPKPRAAFPANPGRNGSVRSGYKPASPHASLSLMQQRQKAQGTHTPRPKGWDLPKLLL